MTIIQHLVLEIKLGSKSALYLLKSIFKKKLPEMTPKEIISTKLNKFSSIFLIVKSLNATYSFFYPYKNKFISLIIKYVYVKLLQFTYYKHCVKQTRKSKMVLFTK